ncbi:MULTISPECIES: YceK/YidQ family lipoprotein [Proteus]|uniref:YceK/YidQ family lipoprotein n=2 Tax=Proteus TaxID=583 RepID=A0A6I7DFE3_9GAMM|nr:MULTISPECIES: YceK/YidQ family lipoprotein [Proteus]MBG2802039.1 YceK/YidQ family lipoprotein [Proteus mirabilis]MBG3019906.1 YceK/YidQ family lipoprotein [Proteus mirabilis]MBG3151644.1 YceK/YidQ family lipoprotein [Proteus mirabilis]QHN12180.1 YceK/YidQ family lipoprotein [Proteus columbae]
MIFRTTSKNLTLVTFLTTLLTGCSSVMTHAGPNKELYSGTKNNMTMLKDDETGWAMKPLVILDLPFSAVLDTLLLPYDYYTQGDDKSDNSPKERIKRLESTTVNNSHENKN